jgi:copper oxidase (laccase) domain-containing protein
VKKHGAVDVYDFLNQAGGFTAFLTTRELTPGKIARHSEFPELFSPLLRQGLNLKKCEQVHGKTVVTVSCADKEVPECDALCTNDVNVALMVSVADCCPVFICDPISGAFGLAHSGKKGTLLNIAGELIAAMRKNYGSRPGDFFAQIGACIRPPYYELDIASMIRQQLIEAGIPDDHIDDCGVNTAADTRRYYSYRAEKGNTGRMAAVLSR